MKKIFFTTLSISLSIILLVLVIRWILYPSPDEMADSVPMLFNDPIQKDSSFVIKDLKLKGYDLKIYSKASFSISGLVVSGKKYYQGIDGALVPMDIGVCWGDLTNEQNKKNLHYEQYLRFLIFRPRGPLTVSQDYVMCHAGNIHIIPADNRIRKVVRSVKKGDLIRMNGYLVSVSGQKGQFSYHRTSSMTRTDTGDGACEVLYVTEIQKGKKIYKSQIQ